MKANARAGHIIALRFDQGYPAAATRAPSTGPRHGGGADLAGVLAELKDKAPCGGGSAKAKDGGTDKDADKGSAGAQGVGLDAEGRLVPQEDKQARGGEGGIGGASNT